MTEHTIKKQVAREYYNVLYGAKLHLASLDICEKLPTVISVISLSFGVLGLSFAMFNSKVLAAVLLIIGIIGIILKPRELQKNRYETVGSSLTDISKKLENLYCRIDEKDSVSVDKARTDLRLIQEEHRSIDMFPPVLLSSWYAHYKVFSEHNGNWMCTELALGWTDKVPLSLRVTIMVSLIAAVLWINPFCIVTKSWMWVSEPCVACWQEEPIVDEQGSAPSSKELPITKPDGDVNH
jgi:hypothetical protein